MKIRKGGITRNINENRWHEYSEKGYKIVPEEECEDFSSDDNKQEEDFLPEDKEPDEEFFAENKHPEAAKAEPETAEDFEKMTVAELKTYAEDNNIDLGEATKKADILKVITGRVW